ncbi:MAG: efflux RND transporter periplasmic adaptor subunit [Thermodesulfobacteriota bacterium]|nr:efflux RND transporter periplasmic adaptor subunit [Thermodesulfobacteriota bacterium]
MKDNDETEETEVRETGGSEGQAKKNPWIRVITFLVCLLILGVGMAGAILFKRTAPRAVKRPPVTMAPLVQIKRIYPGTHWVNVSAMGTVIPAREMILRARVSGEIVAIRPEFVEGGILDEGDEILRIEPADYHLKVVQKQSQVANARYALKLEMGYQDVAKKEWELLKGSKPAKAIDIELALRKPHLQKARADLAAAQAELKQARLDLARTKISAPFNAIIRSKSVEKGSYVAAQEQLAEMVCTDEYWIRASIPVDRLKWISIPKNIREKGAEVRISYRNGAELSGTVIKLMGDLETEGRMARVLICVKDPLALKTPDRDQPPLIIGEFTSLEIEGRQLDNIYNIPRLALRDSTSIWIAKNDGTLKIHNVNTVWRNARTVLIRDGLRPGDRLIISDIPAPVDGMSIKVEYLLSDNKEDLPEPEKAQRD